MIFACFYNYSHVSDIFGYPKINFNPYPQKIFRFPIKTRKTFFKLNIKTCEPKPKTTGYEEYY